MKQGPNSTESQLAMQLRDDAEDALRLSAFGTLVDDATHSIFDKLPENSFMGNHSVNLVCHYFYGLVNHYRKIRKISKEELLKNNYDEVGALSILRDTSLLNHFTMREILKFVTIVPEIEEELINSGLLDMLQKTLLGRYSRQTANKILGKEKQKESADVDNFIIYFANAHYEVAEASLNLIIKQPSLSRMDVRRIASLASSHKKLALEMLQKIGHLFNYYDLSILAMPHYEIFHYIMNEPRLRSAVSKNFYRLVGFHNYDSLKFIANNTQLRALFTDAEFNIMYHAHPEVFNVHALTEFVQTAAPEEAESVLTALCTKSSELAYKIFSIPMFLEKLNPSDVINIIGMNIELLLQIVNKRIKMPNISLNMHFVLKLETMLDQPVSNLQHLPICYDLPLGKLNMLLKIAELEAHSQKDELSADCSNEDDCSDDHSKLDHLFVNFNMQAEALDVLTKEMREMQDGTLQFRSNLTVFNFIKDRVATNDPTATIDQQKVNKLNFKG